MMIDDEVIGIITYNYFQLWKQCYDNSNEIKYLSLYYLLYYYFVLSYIDKQIHYLFKRIVKQKT